ncbi:MAG: PilZ domain-containing protein [Lachnospiraceae bacterium]|nr:PilZ domain-containing protein [Lachnospiraceae bacterium]
MLLKKLERHRVLVRNSQTGTLIADTVIISCETMRNVIKISANSLRERKSAPVTALIFGDGELYEYHGNIRATAIGNTVEVALSKGQVKEDRTARRYPLNRDGLVEAIVYKGCKVNFRKPIWMMTLNVSKNGVLIRTFSGSFQLGDILEMAIYLSDDEKQVLRARYKVVRKQNSRLDTEEYGCHMIVAE